MIALNASGRVSRKPTKAYWNRLSRWFGIAGLVLGAWGLFYPRPYLLVVSLLAAAPFISVAFSRYCKGAIDPVDEANDGWNLGTFTILPPAALALRALNDFPLLDGWALLAYGIALGIICSLLYLWTLPETGTPRRRWEVAFGWVAAIFYGWAVAAMLNGVLPQQEPQRFEVTVLGQHVSGGKTRSYYLKLPPIGNVSQSEDWDVGRRVYDQVSIGSRVCLFIYPGALGEAWYEAASCAPTDGAKES